MLEDSALDIKIESIEQAEFYSKSYKELLQFCLHNSEAQKVTMNKYSDSISPVMHGYQYAISGWPMIVSQDRVKEFDKFIKQVSKLYYKALQVFFANDSKRFSEYFDFPEFYWDLFLQLDMSFKQLFIRHDVLFCNGEIKLLESNVGTNVGGWQHDWFEEEFEKKLVMFTSTNDISLNRRNVLKRLFEFLINSIKKIKPGKREMNIAISFFGISEKQKNAISKALKNICDQLSSSQDKEINPLLFNDFEQFDFLPNKKFLFEGNEVDTFLFSMREDLEMPKEFVSKLLASSLANEILLLDNLMSEIYGHKSLAALLHEPNLKPFLSKSELEFIDSAIPWTARTCAKTACWKGVDVELDDLLKNEKDKFVLKKAKSSQGKDVYIGKSESNDSWIKLVDALREEKDWIAQEYHAPDQALGAEPGGKLKLFDLIWGVFDIDNCYQGAFVRGVLSNKKEGVINSANGAVEFIVYEESNYRKKISI